MGYGLFVTGTDTGVGKTQVACGLLRAFVRRGQRAVGMKPVAAGAEPSAAGLLNDDVVALRAAGNVEAPLAEVNPYCFAPPIAPHIAAAEAGVTVSPQRIADAYAALVARADVVVVEGAGGFLVPLNAEEDLGHLAQRLGLPVVLVVGMRLGCINHALLSAAAVRARGLELAGWVANHIDPAMARADDNVSALRQRLEAPLLARVPHGASADDIAGMIDAEGLYRNVSRAV